MEAQASNPARLIESGSFPDPFLYRSNSGWFGVATGHAANGRIFPMIASSDFASWRSNGGALVPPDVRGTDFWAPEVVDMDGVWRMFYSVGFGDKLHELRVAEARHPSGPFRDTGDPVLPREHCEFAIDAHPFQDDNGKWWLFYARDFLDGKRPGTGIVVAPLEDGRKIGRDFQVVARADRDWQTYERSRVVHGGTYHWHTLEGPSALRRDGKIWLFYSGGNWTNESYGVDWVQGTTPSGPYTSDAVEHPRFLRSRGPWIGPGHNSFVQGPDGQTWTAFHAWDAERTRRQMWLGRVEWIDGQPTVF